jgi:co-chaperonin GroES (HSP10)
MPHKKATSKLGKATRASVENEMAKPRMARSTKIAELNLNTARIPEQPTTSMSGIVDKIIPSQGQKKPEKAKIVVDHADPRHRDLQIENALSDKHGDDVKLKKGAHVELTIKAEPEL